MDEVVGWVRWGWGGWLVGGLGEVYWLGWRVGGDGGGLRG